MFPLIINKTKMRGFQLQTPQKDQNSANRRPKTVLDLKRSMRKTAKTSLNPVSEADSAILESLEEFSKALDDNPFAELAENLLASDNPEEANSSELVAISDLTSTTTSPVTSTPCKHAIYEVAYTKKPEVAYTKKPEVDSLEMGGSVEAEVVLKHLREARVQVLKSNDLGPSKNFMEALINITIKEFHGGVYDEEDKWLDKILFKKSSLVFLCCVMLVCSLWMVWLLDWSSAGSYTGPTPT